MDLFLRPLDKPILPYSITFEEFKLCFKITLSYLQNIFHDILNFTWTSILSEYFLMSPLKVDLGLYILLNERTERNNSIYPELEEI